MIDVEDDASRKILGMIETDGRSSVEAIDLFDEVREEYASTRGNAGGDHRSRLGVLRHKRDEDDNADHAFENYLAEHNMKHTLCAVGRPQTNGEIERFFQTYDKQRWRFESLEAFVDYYNFQRPHQSLRYDELETPAAVFDRLLPSVEDAAGLAVADGGEHGTK